MFRVKLILLFMITFQVFSQEADWHLINSYNSELPNQTIKSIAIDDDGAIWIGTYMGGVAVLRDNEWAIYNTSNSEVPHNYINSIAIGQDNSVWIGTDGGGLAKFDGTNWDIFKTNNSGLPSNVVMSVFSDTDGSIWVGTYFGGIARFNGSDWTTYNAENSPILSNKIVCIAKDNNGLFWFGTQGSGVASFDGVNWNIYTERNSKLTNDYIYSIVVDSDNKKWIGTGGGGVNVFNDVYWINYRSSNSKLTDDNIRPISIDADNNKWIGTYIGGVNFFDGKEWIIFDFQNSHIPDDEITTLVYNQNSIYIGTERSGIIQRKESRPLIAVLQEEKPEEPFRTDPISEAAVIKDHKPEMLTHLDEKVVTPVVIEETPITAIHHDETHEIALVHEQEPEIHAETQEEPIIAETVAAKTSEKEQEKNIRPFAVTQTMSGSMILLMVDAADIHFDKKKARDAQKAFKILLKHRVKVDDSYNVKLLVYSSSFDVNPRKINLTLSEKQALPINEIAYMDGENTFTEALRQAYSIILNNYNPGGSNQLMAATFKFLRDNEAAKVVIREQLDENKIVFTGIAFGSESWKQRTKMRNMVPTGRNRGYLYEVNKPGLKDNWSLSGHIGMSLFRGDIDVINPFAFPGVGGFTVGKQLFSDGNFRGFATAQTNIGKLKGEKNKESFVNNFTEFSLAFKGTIDQVPYLDYRFKKLKPYAQVGIGIISYRTLLRNENGEVISGFGYQVVDGKPEMNPPSPQKDKPVTEIIFPLEIGLMYELNRDVYLTLEAASRYINSDKLDAKIRLRDDKYWLFSIGVSYKLKSKRFMADVLSGRR